MRKSQTVLAVPLSDQSSILNLVLNITKHIQYLRLNCTTIYLRYPLSRLNQEYTNFNSKILIYT